MSITQITTRSSRQNPAEEHRNCISIAKLYDWTEGSRAHVKASGLYKDAACVSHADKTAKLNSLLLVSNGHISLPVFETKCIGYTPNGKMFTRDKKILTRGEKEIIEGIYKNRGDITDRDIVSSKFMVKSHKEAWYSGKSLHRSFGLDKTFLAGLKSDHKSCCRFNRDPRFTSCALCETNSENTVHTSLINTYRNTHYVNTNAIIAEIQDGRGQEGYVAPPSTPIGTDLNLSMRYFRPSNRSLANGSTLQRKNIRANVPYYSKVNEDNQCEPKSPDNVRHKITAGSPHRKTLSTFQRWASDDFSVFALKSRNAAPHGATNTKVTSGGKLGESTSERINNSQHYTPVVTHNKTCADWIDTKETEHDKKVTVNIYLPTAENDVGNCGLASAASVSRKQRRVTNKMLPKL